MQNKETQTKCKICYCSIFSSGARCQSHVWQLSDNTILVLVDHSELFHNVACQRNILKWHATNCSLCTKLIGSQNFKANGIGKSKAKFYKNY